MVDPNVQDSPAKADNLTDAADKPLVEPEKEEIIELFYPNDDDFIIGGNKNILDPDKNYNEAADRNA